MKHAKQQLNDIVRYADNTIKLKILGLGGLNKVGMKYVTVLPAYDADCEV